MSTTRETVIVNGMVARVGIGRYVVQPKAPAGFDRPTEGVTFSDAWETERDALRFAESLGSGRPIVRRLDGSSWAPGGVEAAERRPYVEVREVEPYRYALGWGRV